MSTDLEAQILAHISQPGYRPVKPRVIAKRMGLGEEAGEEVRKAVKRMIKTGQLKWGESHQVMLVDAPGRKSAGGRRQEAGIAAEPGTKKRPAESADPNDSANAESQISNLKSQISNPKSETTSHKSQVSGNQVIKSAKLKSQTSDQQFSKSPNPKSTPPPGGQSPFSPRTPKKGTVPGHAPGHVAGVFRRAQAGFGFVRTDESIAAADRKLDVFIPADRTLDAATGDTVLVRLQKHRDVRRPNPVGEIVEVLERDTHQFVGTYFESAGNAYVQVNGTLFSRPVLVGDPGAKNAQPDDKVVFEMIRFPSHAHDGEGVISEVLGAGSAGRRCPFDHPRIRSARRIP